MTLLDVQRLANHWRHFPPTTVLLRMLLAAHGIKLPEQTKHPLTQPLTAEQFGALVPAINAAAKGS